MNITLTPEQESLLRAQAARRGDITPEEMLTTALKRIEMDDGFELEDYFSEEEIAEIMKSIEDNKNQRYYTSDEIKEWVKTLGSSLHES